MDVSTNRSGMAYGRCAPCGFSWQLKSERGNRLLLAKVRRFEDPDAAPPAPKSAAPEPRESREIPEPQPTPAKPATAAKRGGSFGFWGSVNNG
ncbi:hypothetical protein [Trinickia symbiotica]|uniref:hypothetical protein n=1 Tax=Trinickia symbiotica TaxID=863227 RepID=UPI0011AF5313|nr:hypothetical protein [Trinickia symbiotica]